jgi:hypothetical protein
MRQDRSDLGRRIGARLVAGIVLLACSTAAWAQQNAAPLPSPPESALQGDLEPEVEARLRRMAATIKAAGTFTVRVGTLREGVLPNGQTVLLGASAAIAARKPNQLAASVGSDLGSFTLSYDGTRVTLFNPIRNVYATSPLTGNLERAVGWLEDRLGIDIAVRPFLADDPYGALVLASPTTGMLVGHSVVRGIPVDHFALRNATTDWEIWLESGPRALPLRVSLVGRGENAAGRATMEFENWNLAPRLSERAFAFVPPPGAVPATLSIRPERNVQ